MVLNCNQKNIKVDQKFEALEHTSELLITNLTYKTDLQNTLQEWSMSKEFTTE